MKVLFLLNGEQLFAYFPAVSLAFTANPHPLIQNRFSVCTENFANQCREARKAEYKQVIEVLEGMGYNDLEVLNGDEFRNIYMMQTGLNFASL